jgi:hypothetical protein
VTGAVSVKSKTRTSVQVASSNAKGSSSHQPWLLTVRRKLKSRRTEIAISITDFSSGYSFTSVSATVANKTVAVDQGRSPATFTVAAGVLEVVLCALTVR